MATNLFNFLILSLISFSCTLWTTCHAANRNTLKPGDTLDSSSSLVSANGKFALSFRIYIYANNSNSTYLTIRSVETSHDVWIGNRDMPILYPSSPVLSLDSNQTLKITHPGGDPVTLYSANTSVVATLLDTGNFVVHEENSGDGPTAGRVLWQSFDYPTDTLLPGMKLGVESRNGYTNTWSLTSWDTNFSTEPGPFTLDWDPNGWELKLRRRGVVYWTSGAYRTMRFLVFLPDEIRDRYNFSIVSTEAEHYITYISYNSTGSNQSDDQMPWVLTTMGRLYDTNGGVDIARADYCNGSNTDGGCQQRLNNVCDRHEEASHGYFTPTNSTATVSVDPDTRLNFSDCQAVCGKDCECFGSQALFDNHTGCRYWIGLADWKFVPDQYSGRRTSVFNLAAAAKSGRGNKMKWIWIDIAIAAALLGIIPCIYCFLRIIRKFATSGRNEAMIENELLGLTESDVFTNANGHDLRAFSYASVMAATNNFSKENKLGEGGFGPVYKGILVTGREIAVKRLSRCSGQGMLEFRNELILISELQHMNLVQLLGFCIYGEERMLIYEYMPNKSLDYFLFDSTRSMLLDWKQRFAIIEGIAQGLLYLHKYSRLRVIHRDLKASNVLLDENMNPKISDFGMARIFTNNELQANTNRVVGTYGYMSPEYAMEGIFSIKSDVYSFGVLMLEIISGRKNNSFYNDDRALNIVGYAWELWKEGTWIELMDPILGDSCIRDQFLRCIRVGLLCVEEDAADRPTMSDVLSMLTNENMPLALPTKPAFSVGRKVVRAGFGEKQHETISANGLTYSDFDAR